MNIQIVAVAAWLHEQQRLPGARRQGAMMPTPSGQRNHGAADAAGHGGRHFTLMARLTLEVLAAADQQDVPAGRARLLCPLPQLALPHRSWRRRTAAVAAHAPGIAVRRNGEYSAGAISAWPSRRADPTATSNAVQPLADIGAPSTNAPRSSGCGRWRGRWWEAQGQAGVVNEALMNWLVCTPAARAVSCPLHDLCAAAATVRRAASGQVVAAQTPHYDVAAGHLARRAYACRC